MSEEALSQIQTLISNYNRLEIPTSDDYDALIADMTTSLADAGISEDQIATASANLVNIAAASNTNLALVHSLANNAINLLSSGKYSAADLDGAIGNAIVSGATKVGAGIYYAFKSSFSSSTGVLPKTGAILTFSWKILTTGLTYVWNLVKGVLGLLWDFIKGLFALVYGGFLNTSTSQDSSTPSVIGNIASIVSDVQKTTTKETVTQTTDTAAVPTSTTVDSAADASTTKKGFLSSITGGISNWASGVANTFSSNGKGLIDTTTLGSTVLSGASDVATVASLINPTLNPLGTVVDVLGVSLPVSTTSSGLATALIAVASAKASGSSTLAEASTGSVGDIVSDVASGVTGSNTVVDTVSDVVSGVTGANTDTDSTNAGSVSDIVSDVVTEVTTGSTGTAIDPLSEISDIEDTVADITGSDSSIASNFFNGTSDTEKTTDTTDSKDASDTPKTTDSTDKTDTTDNQ
ncbi:MAG: hypothetical protein S4CHLAM20_00680 [Chlamydiia bacterium]|nr:hypothetical protein [Chlamydiia bacterium]